MAADSHRERIVFRLPTDLKADLDQIAEAEGLPLNTLAQLVLRAFTRGKLYQLTNPADDIEPAPEPTSGFDYRRERKQPRKAQPANLMPHDLDDAKTGLQRLGNPQETTAHDVAAAFNPDHSEGFVLGVENALLCLGYEQAIRNSDDARVWVRPDLLPPR